MSDEEYEYSDEDANESGSGDEGNEVEIEIENAFYEGDDCKVEDPKHAREMFEKVVKLEESNNLEIKWRFKSLEHLVALHFRLGEFDSMLERYTQMLSYIAKSTLTRNECTSAINRCPPSPSPHPLPFRHGPPKIFFSFPCPTKRRFI